METVKTIKISEGYQIDKDKSNDREIVLKPKLSSADEPAKSWEDYVKKMDGKPSVYADYHDMIIKAVFHAEKPCPLEFADVKTLKAYLAYGKLIKLRKDWVKEWEPDWTNKKQWKFSIVSDTDKIEKCTSRTFSRSLSFPTERMRDEFLDIFKDLLEKAKMLL